VIIIVVSTILPDDRIATQRKEPQAVGFRIVRVGPGDSEVRHRSTAIGFCSDGIVLEPAEADVRQQTVADRFRQAGGQAVVVRDGAAGQTWGYVPSTGTRPSHRAEQGCA